MRDAFPPPMCCVCKCITEFGRGGPVCPPMSPHKGASIVKIPRTMRVFLVWKRRYVDVRAGTQAPPLRVSFGWVARGTVDVVWVDCV